jgi:hypothetical protein
MLILFELEKSGFLPISEQAFDGYDCKAVAVLEWFWSGDFCILKSARNKKAKGVNYECHNQLSGDLRKFGSFSIPHPSLGPKVRP